MNDTEQILTAQGIDNPTDANLVRLAGVAVSSPSEDVDGLLRRANFPHPGDAKLARAMIATIRASTPTAQPSTSASRKYVIASAVFAVAAIALGVSSFDLNRTLVKERTAREQQGAQFAQQVAELQSASSKTIADLQIATTNALTNSQSATKESAKAFTTTLGDYVQRINTLTAENERLKAELAATHGSKQP